ncbi:hypothetical protein [Marinobacter mobilis]|uniref:hypothetical protein n=1 Tax=Marinobacter mobilis TaxID=488533 RepID=UPI0035C6B2B3
MTPLKLSFSLNVVCVVFLIGLMSGCTGEKDVAESDTDADTRDQGERPEVNLSAADKVCDLLSAPINIQPIEGIRGREIVGSPQWLVDNDTIVYADSGDAWSYQLSEGKPRCLTCSFDDPAVVHRVNVLADGSFILLGPAHALEETSTLVHDAPSRLAGDTIWWLASDLETPPQSLGYRAFEMVATSRESMTMAWASGIAQGDLVDAQTAMLSPPATLGATAHVARIEVNAGTAHLLDVKEVYHWPHSIVQVNNFLPGDSGLALTTFWSLERRFYPTSEELQQGSYTSNDAEAWTLDLASGELINQSQSPGFDEFEGLHPDGQFAFLESTRASESLDLHVLALGSAGQQTRPLTSRGTLDGSGAADQVVFDASFSPDGRRGVLGLGLSANVQRSIPNHTNLALIEFECGE